MSKHLMQSWIVKDKYGSELIRTYSRKRARRYAYEHIMHCLTQDDPFDPGLQIERWSLDDDGEKLLETEVVT